MTQDLSPISIQLASLADTSSKNKEYLAQIVNHLFADIAIGHSCSKLDEISRAINTSSEVILQLLLQSKISAIYTTVPLKILPMPISIIQMDKISLIYITKYLGYEIDVVRQTKLLAQNIIPPVNLTQYMSCLEQLKDDNDLPNADQLQAIHNCAIQRLSFITGGPGTGKTTTVTLLLWLLYQLYGESIKVKICAPTGKAASRVKDSITGNINFFKNKGLPIDLEPLNHLLTDNFGTIHKLLGYIKHSIYFKHNPENPLAIDILIIDESSMIGLPLFSKLLQAVNHKTIKHIIFLGDKNQLSSVEEGYVFASLIQPRQDTSPDLFNVTTPANISELRISKRNSGDIGVLTNAVLHQDMDKVNQILASSNSIKLQKPAFNNVVKYYLNSEVLNEYFIQVEQFKIGGEKQLFEKFNQQSLLCLTNIGILGTLNLNQQIEKQVKLRLCTTNLWYTGRPVIILQNDYSLSLNNGDIGICIVNNNQVWVIFEDGRMFIPEVLPSHQLAYALSIHKSQGSEYEHVNIVLPTGDTHNMCSRELLYTAVSRAKKSITLFSTQLTIANSIRNVLSRNTGLVYLL